MRLGIVVNDVTTEEVGYTTTRLGLAAASRGHEVFVMGLADLAYDVDERVRARVRRPKQKTYKSAALYLRDIAGPAAAIERITVDELDVLLLRSDPSTEAKSRPWAPHPALMFARLAARRGVIVLNDPVGLSQAMSKMYLQEFPEEVRPRTIITRDRGEIRRFAKDEGGPIVLKPLQGSGGQNVFLVRPDELANLNQMIDAVSRDGYVIAQEYLPKAEVGDTRLFLMNGLPLRTKGHYCAFQRFRVEGDLRSNLHAGGDLGAAIIDDAALRIAEIVRPRLVADGMWMVGLDIVGDKLMEINVFSPGGLGSAQKFEGVNFAPTVVEDLERKVRYMTHYGRQLRSSDLSFL
jgi:glutathione synthase